MRGLWALFGKQLGDLMLVGSLVTAPPAWLGSTELLAALGLDGMLAAVLSGLFVWGRITVAGSMLLRRAHSGDLTLRFGGLFSGPRATLAGSHVDPRVCAAPLPLTSVAEADETPTGAAE